MNTQPKKVKGLISCAGAWGTLSEGEIKELDIGIAESLILGGLAEDVEPGRLPEINEAANQESAAAAAKVLAQAQAAAAAAKETPPSKPQASKPTRRGS